MDDYKKEFIRFLLAAGALKVGGDFTLKSKRMSPWFMNLGDLNDGQSLDQLGVAYAKSILASTGDCDIDILYGIPEKGNMLVAATAIALSREGVNKPAFFTRKVPKEYGESTGLTAEERIKSLVVGRAPRNGQCIVQLDDVFTAGDAKHEAHALLNGMGNFKLPLLAIAVDRQEVGIDGKSAIEEYEGKTGTHVVPIVDASEIYTMLKDQNLVSPEDLQRMANYMRVYGTKSARDTVGRLEQKIVGRDRSVIPACDIDTIEQFEELVKRTADIEGIGGYKIGFELVFEGLAKVVETARKYTDKPIIYDHQKAATDIPETGKAFARKLKKAGVDAVILSLQAGPETERAWIYHAFDHGLKVIVGGRMTHPSYSVSEGGFITDAGALEMYRIAARGGVDHFVVPGNKPEVIKEVRTAIEAEGVTPVFYAPGFIAQGGSISDAAKVAGDRFHGIVSRGIYSSKDMREAAIEHTSQLAALSLET